jgi:hypothetical protein
MIPDLLAMEADWPGMPISAVPDEIVTSRPYRLSFMYGMTRRVPR